MALMDSTTTNRESFYVTVSRAKHCLALYTANKIELAQWAEVSKAKEREVVSSPEDPYSTFPITKQPVTTTITTELSAQEQSIVPNESPHPEIGQLRTEPPLPESDSQPSAKQKYVALWQRYSQGLTVSAPVNIDLQVAQRALKDRQARKDIALMLSAGSPIVRRIIQAQGKQPAMLYVNQMVRKIISHQPTPKTRLHQLRRGRQMELN